MTDKQNNAGQMDGQKNSVALAHLTIRGSHVAASKFGGYIQPSGLGG